MKRYIRTLCLMLSTAVLLAACKDDDEWETTLYNDIAITGFSITSATVYKTITAEDGSTSTSSTVDKSVSAIPFYIDQLNGKIYNVDPLPAGADLTKLTCSYATKNNGLVYIENPMDGSWEALYVDQEINLSTTRNIYVTASDNTASRKYAVTVTVGDGQNKSFGWTRMADNEKLAELTDVKAVSVGDRLVVMGVKNGTTVVYSTTDGNEWTEGYAGLGGSASVNVAALDGSVMVLDGTTLKRSDDGGMTFADVAYTTDGFALKQLVGANTRQDKDQLTAAEKEPKPAELYALTDDGRIGISTDGGQTWTAEDGVTDDARWLPVEDVAFCSSPFAYNTMTDYVVMVGNRQRTLTDGAGNDAANEEANAVVWRKIVEYAPGSKDGKWTFINADDTFVYPLPRMKGLTVAGYDGRLLATGGAGIGGSDVTPYGKLYESRDGGITWKDSNIYNIPEGFDTNASSVTMAVDGDNRLWLVCGGTGQVWCGRP